ncbi:MULTISPECIES: shikimate dehydrogenase [unclassified Moraxella]|uniref:shikimate dehydrogenase n=1 Tax=unclassified Moraxella TaxID=2685852 RepID=UPI003AF5DDC4
MSVFISDMLSNPHYHCMVIGNPIAHSKSPELHQAFAKQTGVSLSYQRQLCPNDEASFVAVVEAFFAGGGTGMNVTVPFKEMAYELVNQRGELSEYAKLAGAVNTLAIKDGKLYGDNTDGRGLVADLLAKGVVLDGKNVAILGAGGATRGAILPLLQANIQSLHIANRTVEKAETLAKLFDNKKVTFSSLADLPKNFDVVINATSIGLSGDSLPFNADLTADFAYDMMYGKPSAFLDFFRAKNVKTADGLGMLINQGALSFELWTGKQVDLEALGNPF